MAYPLLLIDLLNQVTNPHKDFITLNLKFGTTKNNDDGKSQITLTGVGGRGYYGSVDVKYRKIDLSTLGTQALYSTETFTADGIITMLNNMLGTDLTTDDVVDFSIPDIPTDSTVDLPITAQDTSIEWSGTLAVTLTVGRPFLNAVVASRLLSVLNHGIPNVNGLPYAKVIMFDLDFSSLRDDFVTNPNTGIPVDFSNVQGTLSSMGYPAFNFGRLKINKTSDIADSNQNFTNVATVDISSSGMVGPLYLHYNLFDK